MSKGNTVHILMTGAGAPGAPGILRCLKEEPSFEVMGVDANAHTGGRLLFGNFAEVPVGDHPDFIPVMLDLCRKNNIHVVMPLVTKELEPLAAHLDQFELAGARVMVSPPSSLEIANNKGKLYEFLEWRGLPVPNYRIIEQAGQLREACTALGYPEKPVVVKPCLSNGGRGFRILDETFDPLSLFFQEKPGQPLMRLAELESLLSSTPGIPFMLVTEYLPGREISVDCLCRHGETLMAVPRTREKLVNGISVAGEFVEDRQAVRYASAVISALKLHGNIGLQLRESSAGQWLILEINPRVQGTISAALGAGVNLPALGVKLALGLDTGRMPPVRWGTRFARFWDEKFS